MSAEPRILRTEAEQGLIAGFREAEPGLPGGPVVAEMRRAAMAAFERSGLPHRRVEAWKYTDLRALLRHAAPVADRTAPPAGIGSAPDLLAGMPRAVIAIVDGRFRPDLSDFARLPGVVVDPLADVLVTDPARVGRLLDPASDPLIALNAAMMADGVVVRVAAGASPATVLEIRHATTTAEPRSTFVRHVIEVEEGASLRLVESHTGPAGVAYQSFPAVELHLADRATAVVARVQAEGDRAVHIASFAARLGARSSLKQLTVTAGASLSRAQSFLTIAGEGARLGAYGATMLGGRAHGDVSLVIDHQNVGAESRVLFKNVVDGDADGAFQGRIVVRPGAQKTDGRMMMQSLLLSETAEFASKPELEIYADDVQCGHGATSGQIDEDMLFYLLSRGIPRPEAEQLLITAFLASAIEALEDEQLAAALEPLVSDWLARRGSGA